MKRSEINQILQEAELFFARFSFKLPIFSTYSVEDWDFNGRDREIFDCALGWDITDFGQDDFANAGLLLFTIRNGVLGSKKYTKPYAEKIMISRENQKTLMHYHVHKTEDIINRGGGLLAMHLYNSTKDNGLADSIVEVYRDGELLCLNPGEKLLLKPGESVTLTPYLFHSFYAEPGTGGVMLGEVSAVNDDHYDNIFYEVQQRFPTVEEDEAPYRLLVSDYETCHKLQ
jgi:D-lyxose ketol-isomerase